MLPFPGLGLASADKQMIAGKAEFYIHIQATSNDNDEIFLIKGTGFGDSGADHARVGRVTDLTGMLSAGFVVPAACYVLIPGFGIWAVKTASSGEGPQGAQI